MATTAADVLVDTLIDWGVDTIFGIPGDGINGIIEALRHEAGADPLRPGAPRGGRRLHGLRLRQVDRTARRLHRHLRPRRHPPAQRPLRRQARRPARPRHHGPSAPRSAAHLHPAGRRARQAVHGRVRLQRPRHGPGARRERRRPRLPHGARLPGRRARHHPGRHAIREGVLRPPFGAQHPGPRLGPHGRERAYADRGPARARRRDPERGQEDRASWPGAARSNARAEVEASPSGSARRSSSRCSARACCPTTARTRPAASACSAPRRRRTRWRAATRC